MRLGVCYYPEQWPREWWPDDARAMAAMGIGVVRLGEFAWSRLEPEPGRFDWGWLDEAVETLAAEGLRLVLGTRDLTIGPGEVVEFDTRTPHWVSCPGPHPAEVLAIFGPQGERMHVRT